MKKLKGFYNVLVQSRPHVSYSTSNGRKVSFKVCRTGRDAQESPSSLRRVLLPELQRVAESRWHLQRNRPTVRQVNACFNTNASLFSCNRQYLVQTFCGDETRSYTSEQTDECLPIVPAFCPRQLSRYSSPAANGKLASFSAASC